jgi:hypothetical protein
MPSKLPAGTVIRTTYHNVYTVARDYQEGDATVYVHYLGDLLGHVLPGHVVIPHNAQNPTCQSDGIKCSCWDDIFSGHR